MKGYAPKTTGKYKKDYCRCAQRHWDMNLLDSVVKELCQGEHLEAKYHDHPLSGNWVGCRECHIQGDWVLIYEIEVETLILRRTGSHSDVF